jgi:hypothetical protein
VLVVQFAEYLFTEVHLIAARVSAQISGLAFGFQFGGGAREPFESTYLKAFRQGLYKQPLPPGRKPRSRVPTSLDMIMDYHDANSGNESPMLKRALCTGMALAYCCLLRPSEYLTHTKHDQHVLLAESVTFECALPGEESVFLGAHELRREGIRWCDVKLVRIEFLTAKNFDERNRRALWFTAHLYTSTLDLPRMLFDWAIAARLRKGDFFMSWVFPGALNAERVTLCYDVMQKTIKEMAVAFGFSPERFGCHGLRIGGACLLRAAGAKDTFILLMGRWKSLPACLKYQEASTADYDRMLSLLCTMGLYTSRDLRIRYPRPRHEPIGEQDPTNHDSADTCIDEC